MADPNNIDLRMDVIHTLGLSFIELGNPGLAIHEEIDDCVKGLIELPDGNMLLPEPIRLEIKARFERKLRRKMPSF
jgi:hypothetical protein